MVFKKLLLEGFEKIIKEFPLSDFSQVVLLDTAGGKEGLEVSQLLLNVIGKQCRGSRYIHVAFSTPFAGLGTLVRNKLVDVGADNHVFVDVVANNVHYEAFEVTPDDARKLTSSSSITIIYAPSGRAAFMNIADIDFSDYMFLESNLAVLSWPSPSYLPAELDNMYKIVDKLGEIDNMKFAFKVLKNNKVQDLGYCLLFDDEDTLKRLGVLLDNAQRLPYCVIVEPLFNSKPVTGKLIYPSKAWINIHMGKFGKFFKTVPSGSKLNTVIFPRAVIGGRR